MEKKINVTNDLIFQRIFGKSGNEIITKGFLEKILGIKIESLTLDTNKRLIGKLQDDKIGRIDVKARLNDGTKVIIEMQVATHKYMAKRLLYYWAETYIGDLKRGDEYAELSKTIAILISVEDLKETIGIDKYHTKWNIREEEYLDRKLNEELEIHIIELGKYIEGKEQVNNWIRFLKGEELENMGNYDKGLEEARKELQYLLADPELRKAYEQRIIDLRDMLTYARAEHEEGFENGIKEGKKEVVLNMHKKHIEIDEICEIVNLSREEIEEIIKDNLLKND